MKFQKLNYVVIKSANYHIEGAEPYSIGKIHSIRTQPHQKMNLDLEIGINDYESSNAAEESERLLNGIVDYQIYRKFGLGLTDLLELIRNEYPEKFI